MNNLQKWIEERYAKLWEAFKENEFYKDDATKVLVDNFKKDNQNTAMNVLSELKKEGLVETSQDKKDARKTIYKLKKSDYIEKLTRGDINAILKKAADLIRTRVDYKFILILLFMKRISDKWDEEYENAIEEAKRAGLNEEQAKEEAKKAAYHDFDLPEDYRWENLRKEVSELPERFSKALKKIAELNPELKDIFDNADFIQFTSNTENADILRQLVELFSEKKLNSVSADVLGDAYEWILGYFAPQKAKEGEVYTPREVIRLIVEILKPKPEESVYDPASASNGMLIISYDYVKEKYGKEKADRLFLYGQEANYKTLALGRMNMYIHDIRNVQLAFGDTLTHPKFKDKEKVEQFDYVIANPPWNQDGYHEERIKQAEFWKSRFRYGFVPKQSADWAWIQHMLASSKDKTGKVGIVIDNGCLFRGSKEKAIRRRVVEENLIEAIILLPEKLFYNTGAPGAIIIFNKDKPKERKNKILFINASKEFEKHPEVRKLNILTKNNIKKIVEVYDKFKDENGFSRAVDLGEIRENDYNLNVTLYCFPEEPEEKIIIEDELKNLKDVEKEEKEVTDKLLEMIREVG